jgi:hypothetical protein
MLNNIYLSYTYRDYVKATKIVHKMTPRDYGELNTNNKRKGGKKK